MKNLIIIILILISNNIFAESSVLKCKGSDDSKWTNCFSSVSKNGTTYVGNFVNGKMHGKGTFTYSDGATYVGEFKNGKEHGVGTFRCWQHGSKYEGEFKYGKKHGIGTYTYPDGVIYVGDWVQGKRHGSGVITYPGGRKQSGKFENDRYLKNKE